MKIFELLEDSKTAVMTFARMNPPTIGHAKLIRKMTELPGDPYVFLSQTYKPDTDPLLFADKARYVQRFFPSVTVGDPEVRTVVQAFQKVQSLGYSRLIFVAGEDRIDGFQELLNKYNGKDFSFSNIKCVSSGERDPDSDGVEGMSASKMRAAAAAGDLATFTKGTPDPKVAQHMFNKVRSGMGVTETVV